MLLVTARIGRLGQSDHLFCHLLRCGMDGSASPVSMGEGGRSLLSIGGQHPSHLSIRQAQARSGFRHCRVPSQDGVQHDQSFLFFSVQCDARFHMRTFSLNTYPGHNH